MTTQDLYQQVIIDHHKKPRNFRKIEKPSHQAEGFNPLCGDHLWVYMNVNAAGTIDDISFEGDGCAISKASASMMTQNLKGKTVADSTAIFNDFHKMVLGQLDPEKDAHVLGRLAIFSGIWKYPARVKCAALAWHTMNGALSNEATISTE
jgi:nitrogen fixation protein NifU and related proteins